MQEQQRSPGAAHLHGRARVLTRDLGGHARPVPAQAGVQPGLPVSNHVSIDDVIA